MNKYKKVNKYKKLYNLLWNILYSKFCFKLLFLECAKLYIVLLFEKMYFCLLVHHKESIIAELVWAVKVGGRRVGVVGQHQSYSGTDAGEHSSKPSQYLSSEFNTLFYSLWSYNESLIKGQNKNDKSFIPKYYKTWIIVFVKISKYFVW